MFTSQQHNSNHHIPANSDGYCHRVRQARVLVGFPGRVSNRRDRLGPRLPVLSSVYHANSIVEAAKLPLRIEGRGPRERTRNKDRVSRLGGRCHPKSTECKKRVLACTWQAMPVKCRAQFSAGRGLPRAHWSNPKVATLPMASTRDRCAARGLRPKAHGAQPRAKRRSRAEVTQLSWPVASNGLHFGSTS